jgi:hypothetical protein
MKLRNGKHLYASVPVITGTETKEQFIKKMLALIDRCQPSATGTTIDKLHNMLPCFTAINQMPLDLWSTFDVNLRFHATLYRKTVELTITIIERSYMYRYSDDEKTASIRLLSEMYKARQTFANILWKGRTNKNVQDMMDAGYDHSEPLYRCLKHIVSDNSESTYYAIYSYDDREYSDVELYDWYLSPNFDSNLPDDEYINNADSCFGGDIDRFNMKLWN